MEITKRYVYVYVEASVRVTGMICLDLTAY